MRQCCTHSAAQLSTSPRSAQGLTGRALTQQHNKATCRKHIAWRPLQARRKLSMHSPASAMAQLNQFGQQAGPTQKDQSSSPSSDTQQGATERLEGLSKHPWTPAPIHNLLQKKQTLLASDRFLDFQDFLAIFTWHNIFKAIRDAARIVKQFTYPSFKEVVWKSGTVVVAIMVLLVMVCTFDNSYVLWLANLPKTVA